MDIYTMYLPMYVTLLQYVRDRLKIIFCVVLIAAYLGVWQRVVCIFLLAMCVSAVYLCARVLHRFVGDLLWGLIITTLALLVYDVDTLLVWTLGFLFGILGITTMDVFLDTKIHSAYLIVFVHLMFFLSAIYAKVDSIAVVSSRNHKMALQKDGANSSYNGGIWWCFFWAIISGSFYSGILEEHNQYYEFQTQEI